MSMSSSDRLDAIAQSWRTTHLRTGEPLKGAIMDVRLSAYPWGATIERLRDGRGTLDPNVKEFVADPYEDAYPSMTYVLQCGLAYLPGAVLLS